MYQERWDNTLDNVIEMQNKCSNMLFGLRMRCDVILHQCMCLSR